MDDRQEQAASKIGAALFRKRRTLSRILAMQFVFQADLKNVWDAAPDLLTNFKELAQDILLVKVEDAQPTVDDRTSFTDADFKSAWKYADTLIKGVVANHSELDTMICNVTQNWSLQRISLMDRAILRVAAFEILKAPNGVTPAIAINEAVEIAKSYGLSKSPSFVNGILDKIRKMLQDNANGSEDVATPAPSPAPQEPTGEQDETPSTPSETTKGEADS